MTSPPGWRQPTVRGDLTVMHGDYKLDNVLWSRQPPPRVISVVDFEMTTVGDPLIDLAWALIFWPEDGNLIALASPELPTALPPTSANRRSN